MVIYCSKALQKWMEGIETLIEEVETRLYNIRQEKIFGDNVYQFLLFLGMLNYSYDEEKIALFQDKLKDIPKEVQEYIWQCWNECVQG